MEVSFKVRTCHASTAPLQDQHDWLEALIKSVVQAQAHLVADNMLQGNPPGAAGNAAECIHIPQVCCAGRSLSKKCESLFGMGMRQ